MMKLKLNVTADKPTVNGRIYTRKVLEEALSKNKSFSIVLDKPHNLKIDVKDIIATTKTCEMNDTGEIFITIDKVINSTLGKILKQDILLGFFGVGEVKENFVKNFHILAFYPVMTEDGGD